MEKDIFKQRRQMLADMILNNELYVPMKAKEIAMLLDIPKAKRSELIEVLDSLVADGTIGVSKKGKYMKPENVALVGTFESTSRGFGFVVIPDREDDIFVKANDTMNAFYHDKVKVVITIEKNGGKRAEGKIVAIVEHEVKEVVGTFQKNRTYGFVIPDNAKINCDIFIPQEFMNGAVEGSKVVASISDYGSQSKNPQGKVTEVLGHIDDPGVDIMSIIKAYDLPVEFPESVKKALNDIPDIVSEKDKAGRVDLRNIQMVTIDGEDAKDLDDAVSISKEGPVYHLGVHIADVSHYVTEGSTLDKEALKRGTSVYLVDRVIPMIPHKLSNGICSLNQGEDRLALSCKAANLVPHLFLHSLVIKKPRLQLDIGLHSSGCNQLQILFQRGNSLRCSPPAVCRVQAAQFRQGMVFDISHTICRPVHTLIMDHHHFPIPGEVNIQFHAVRSALHRLLKSQDGIFRIPAAVSSVANDLRHHSHTSCRILPHFTPHRPKVQLESSGSGKTAESAIFPLPPLSQP